jgi:rhodanese-related sulfurtransferase
MFPTHGFGSFCSSSPSSGQTSGTLVEECRANLALTTGDEDEFVRRLTAGLADYPAYYVHIAPRNLSGPAPVDLSAPERANAEVLRQRIAAGEWVVDLRPRTDHAPDHIAATVNIGLDGSFATYLGWLAPWGVPITLLAEDEGQIAEAQRELVRIGIDRPAGAVAGTPAQLADPVRRRAFRVATFGDLVGVGPSQVILDVRREDEWRTERIPSAHNVPLHLLEGRIDDVPSGQVWVLCQSGYRAGIAASLLDGAGRDVVLIDDDFAEASRLGITLGAIPD